jgi:hypothetical protein
VLRCYPEHPRLLQGRSYFDLKVRSAVFYKTFVVFFNALFLSKAGFAMLATVFWVNVLCCASLLQRSSC